MTRRARTRTIRSSTSSRSCSTSLLCCLTPPPTRSRYACFYPPVLSRLALAERSSPHPLRSAGPRPSGAERRCHGDIPRRGRSRADASIRPARYAHECHACLRPRYASAHRWGVALQVSPSWIVCYFPADSLCRAGLQSFRNQTSAPSDPKVRSNSVLCATIVLTNPPVPSPPIFKAGSDFRTFLLTKCTADAIAMGIGHSPDPCALSDQRPDLDAQIRPPSHVHSAARCDAQRDSAKVPDQQGKAGGRKAHLAAG